MSWIDRECDLDDLDLDVSSDLKGIMSALQQIREIERGWPEEEGRKHLEGMKTKEQRANYQDSWLDQVTWVTGDVFYLNWDEVVSTIGGFGNEEHMKIINGEANVIAVNAATDFDVMMSATIGECRLAAKAYESSSIKKMAIRCLPSISLEEKHKV